MCHHGGNDVYIVKLDSSGDISWQTMLGGSSVEQGFSIQQTAYRGYILAGHSGSSDVYGPEPVQSNKGLNDFYIIKLW